VRHGSAGVYELTSPVSLLALNGLRVPEATGANIEALGTERGHRALAITRKGGKRAVIPLAPRTARATDLAIGERCKGPIFTTLDGSGWTALALGTGNPHGGRRCRATAPPAARCRSRDRQCARPEHPGSSSSQHLREASVGS
jgi:integrase